MTYVFLILGIFFLIKGADLLVDGSVAIAKQFNVSNLVIGLTLVAFGTSAPELVVNITSSFLGKSNLAIGNILGSNIANIFLILGVAAIIYPIKPQKKTLFIEIPFNLFLVVLLFILANNIFTRTQPNLGLIDGIILLVLLILFLYYAFFTHKKIEPEGEIENLSFLKAIILIILGLLGLYFGGHWVVNSAVKLARSLGISEELIGLSIVAIGTSLPELVTSAVAATKKESDIAIGNIVGSNIFNITWVLGLSAIIHPIKFDPVSNISLLICGLATLLLFLFTFLNKKREINIISGIFFLLIYISYMIFLFLK